MSSALITKNYPRENIPQAYIVPGIGKIKVEKINDKRYVAHFPDGLERVERNRIEQEKWKNLGPWEEKWIN